LTKGNSMPKPLFLCTSVAGAGSLALGSSFFLGGASSSWGRKHHHAAAFGLHGIVFLGAEFQVKSPDLVGTKEVGPLAMAGLSSSLG